MSEPLRKCRDCGLEAHTEQDLELFQKNKRSLYGRSNCCDSCANKRSKKYIKVHQEERAEYQRKRRKTQPETLLGQQRDGHPCVPMPLRRALLKRANYDCEKRFTGRCKGSTVIHHIDNNPSNNKLENLSLLCRRHHTKIHRVKTLPPFF